LCPIDLVERSRQTPISFIDETPQRWLASQDHSMMRGHCSQKQNRT
jgi:hypothetical protein